MDSNLIVLTDQDGNSVRFELLDIVEYKEDEYAVLYPADGGDDEPVHILRIISENLDVNEAEFEGLDDDELIDNLRQGYDVVQLSSIMGTNINLMLIKLNEMNRMGWRLNLPYVPHSDFLKNIRPE